MAEEDGREKYRSIGSFHNNANRKRKLRRNKTRGQMSNVGGW